MLVLNYHSHAVQHNGNSEPRGLYLPWLMQKLLHTLSSRADQIQAERLHQQGGCYHVQGLTTFVKFLFHLVWYVFTNGFVKSQHQVYSALQQWIFNASKFKYDSGKNKHCDSLQAVQVGFLETLVEYFVSYRYLLLPNRCFPSRPTYRLPITLWSY